MLHHPTCERLAQLRLFGMVQALTEQAQAPDLHALTFEERLGLLVDREIAERQNRQTRNRLRQARLKQAAVAEDIDYRHPRGLDRALVRRLLALSLIHIWCSASPPKFLRWGRPAKSR